MDMPCPHCDDPTLHTIEKYCLQCQKTLPHTLMATNRQGKDGLRSVCKAHWAAYMKTRYEADKPTWAKRMADYKKEHRQELTQKETTRRRELVADPILGLQERKRSAENAARWREANPDKAHASVNTYGAANKERINKRRRERYAENPEKPLANTTRRKTRIRGASQSDFTALQWRTMKEYSGYRCVYCSKKFHHLTRDHLTAVSEGGADTLWNILPACQSCNAKKRTGAVLCPVQPFLLL